MAAVLAVSWCADLSFPPGVEGACDEGGKTNRDRFVHEDPRRVADLSNGDVACDSYHQWKRDIELAEELGIHFYRFSISWPRILPSGFYYDINKDGKNYYNNLIDGLLEKGIEPVVTMYHGDLPESIQDDGAWTNPLIVDWFVDYARVLYNLFGDRVKIWLTFNEPIIICHDVYTTSLFGPVLFSPEIAAYFCNKYVLLAHAKAWRLYDEEFKPKYHGKVSIANQIVSFYPKTKEGEDLAEPTRHNCGGRYTHAIYSKEGGWAPSIEKHMEELSLKRRYPRSAFPAFTQEEIETIRGTYDFFALNHYTSRVIRQAKEGEQFSAWPLGDAVDLNAKIEKQEDCGNTASFWFFVNPEGIRKQLVWMKERYGDMDIMILENGLATFGGFDDQNRVQYYRDYLEQILRATKEDFVNVTTYTAWTLIDNFEWMDGYSLSKFGLCEVDFSDLNNRKRKRKRSALETAHYCVNFIKSHSLEVSTTGHDFSACTSSYC